MLALVDDDVVSFAQSDLDAVGAYGGVRVDVVERHTVDEFLTRRPEDVLCD